jgi:hypothetical protein
MSKDRPEADRGYPPDYVSAETLAYRLDCGVEVIEALMRRGALPRPRLIGGLKRWEFAAVRLFVESQNRVKRLAPNGRPGPDEDAFLAALEEPAKDKA